MELPIIDNADAYMEVCKKANLPYNKLPKKGDDIPLAYEIAMKELNPHLYQNITSPDPDNLPVDVAKRYKQGLMWTSDLQAYEDNGFTGTAANIRKEMDQARQLMIDQEIEAMKKRNDARDEAIRNRPKGMQGMPPLSPEAIARARAQWGITGEPTY